MPDLLIENTHGHSSGKIICGVDEAGRGPLAGPVVAAAVIIPNHGLPAEFQSKINDSKKLSERQRSLLYPYLTEYCAYSTAQATVEEIDTLNILHASLLAMSRAIHALSPTPDHALIDGNKLPQNLPCTASAIIRGDGKSLSIAAASIIAKVTRDNLMSELSKEYPHYGWEKNAGYGTALHLEGIRLHGTTVWHRQSFGPVKEKTGLTK